MYVITYLEVEQMLDGSYYVWEVSSNGNRKHVFQSDNWAEVENYCDSRPYSAVSLAADGESGPLKNIAPSDDG